MEQLKYGKMNGHWAVAEIYCRVFPLSKCKNGFYKCRLTYNSKSGECNIEWAIPGKYIEEDGHAVASNDVFFARFLLTDKWETEKDEDGNIVKNEFGEPKSRQVLVLGRMIDIWNTRIFGEPTKKYLDGLED